MYNRDVATIYSEIAGPGSVQLLGAGDRFIVGASIQQSGVASTSEIQCGSSTFVKNYGKDFPYNQISFRCTSAINITKTGQDSASYILSYIPESSYRTSTGSMELGNNTSISLGNSMYIIWLCLGIIIMLQAIKIGTYIYKK